MTFKIKMSEIKLDIIGIYGEWEEIVIKNGEIENLNSHFLLLKNEGEYFTDKKWVERVNKQLKKIDDQEEMTKLHKLLNSWSAYDDELYSTECSKTFGKHNLGPTLLLLNIIYSENDCGVD